MSTPAMLVRTTLGKNTGCGRNKKVNILTKNHPANSKIGHSDKVPFTIKALGGWLMVVDPPVFEKNRTGSSPKWREQHILCLLYSWYGWRQNYLYLSCFSTSTQDKQEGRRFSIIAHSVSVQCYDWHQAFLCNQRDNQNQSKWNPPAHILQQNHACKKTFTEGNSTFWHVPIFTSWLFFTNPFEKY